MLNRVLTGLCLLLVCGWMPVYAYTVKGNIGNVAACYYPRVYLEVIKDIGGIYGTNTENLIASADIDKDGHFILSGRELPKEPMYYRLYVTESAGVESAIKTGLYRNYVLLLLNNNSNINITVGDICQQNFTYTVTTAENQAIGALQGILTGFIAERLQTKKERTSRKEFLSGNEYDELKHFADTCSNSLAGLLAVAEMDPENTYSKDKGFYTAFLARLETDYPQSVYTTQYREKLELTAIMQEKKSGTLPWGKILLYAGLTASVLLNIYLLFFRRQVIQVQTIPHANNPDREKQVKEQIEGLSIKEREILLMVHKGMSNKEIANVQNVELSTIKTHISRIYQKTGISSRKEVAAIAKHLDN